MDIEAVNDAFRNMITQRNIHRLLDLDSQKVRNYRIMVKSGKPMSLDLKINLLRKAGLYKEEEKSNFTRTDLNLLIEWYNGEKQIYEPDYAVHKWLLEMKRKGVK